jgi:hypothetical protein
VHIISKSKGQAERNIYLYDSKLLSRYDNYQQQALMENIKSVAPKNELIVMSSNRADDALRRMFRENKSRIFVCEENEIKKQRGQKLFGLVSKTEILNVAKEREEFDKAVKKLSASNSNNEISTDGSNFGKTIITSSSLPSSSSSSYSYPPSHDNNNKFNILSRWRFLFFIFGMIVFISAYSVGAAIVHIDASQAEFIKTHFQEQIKGINQYGIFANNLRVALGMFIPVGQPPMII